MTIDEINSKEESFRYQLLDRLRCDCNYFLENGQRNPKYLWADTPEEHIAYMKGIWKGFPEDKKPQWLSFKDILAFEDAMLG